MPSPNGTAHPLIGRLHVLTDFVFQQQFSHAELARQALAGGADVIQFRQKRGGPRHLLPEARSTLAVCRESKRPLVINDRIDVMLATEADGIHLGQDDLPIADARRIVGSSVLIGATATTVRQARAAEQAGADYIGFGPVFSTRSKANPATVKGIEGLAAVCGQVRIPVIAIAGMTPDRVRPALEAGAYGIAVMTAITTDPAPEAATRRFREAIDEMLNALP